jgi:RimJ/RimL family protein N-acetyltransferase
MRIETERLILRDWGEGDVDAYAEMLADPLVAQWTNPNRAPMDRQAAWRNLAMVIGHKALRGYSMFAVEEKATGALAGRVGPWQPEGWPGLEIGWTLAPAARGKGYALEAARASAVDAFERLDAQRIVSLVEHDNAASRKVAERLGERLVREGEVQGKPCLVFGLERELARQTDWYDTAIRG